VSQWTTVLDSRQIQHENALHVCDDTSDAYERALSRGIGLCGEKKFHELFPSHDGTQPALSEARLGREILNQMQEDMRAYVLTG